MPGTAKTKTRIILISLLILVAVIVLTKNVLDRSTETGGASAIIAAAKGQHLPVWILFRSESCAACLEMMQIFYDLRPRYEDKIVFLEVDVYDKQEEKLISEHQFS